MDFSMRRLRAHKWPDKMELRLDGETVQVSLRVHARARSYRLSLPATGRPALTVPPHGRLDEAQDFLNRHSGWLAARLKRVPGPKILADGERLPLRGQDHLIVGENRLRGTVRRAEGDPHPLLYVPGGPDHLARRLTDWLKAEALKDVGDRVAVHAKTLGVSPASVRMRDQSSRWGSCSSAGRLNFNWRLVMAPPFVLDYVAAHEVAHMREMNHSSAFWQTVEQALPDMERGRAWLRAHGSELMTYGR